MSTLQGMIARKQEANRVGNNPRAYSAEGGACHTRTEDEQAQFERNEASRWRFSITKCYGPVKPKELA
jgi:hypothetical protein